MPKKQLPRESHYPTSEGVAYPLGATRLGDWLNFSIFSKEADRITITLYATESREPLVAIALDPKVNRTGDIWHIAIRDLPRHVVYGYRAEGPSRPEDGLFYTASQELLDPYAKGIHSHLKWGRRKGGYNPRAVADPQAPFDWEGDRPLRLPASDLILYEMHVRSFTVDPSSQVKAQGCFLGIVEKIDYLKELGINAVELMPIHEFDECSYKKINPTTQKELYQYWGYSTLNFFTPMTRYATRDGHDPQTVRAILEFKTMVRELHKAGIEVILDVVYNHIGEDCLNGPSLSYRGFAPSVYYMKDAHGHFANYTGCGNTVNSNHPVVIGLIIDSLRYWVEEMHVDGFRFDLASIFTRSESGAPLPSPPLIEAISKDPLLAGTRLIAEAWDAVGLYQVGLFPSFGPWSDWNGKFRDTVRRFIKGADGEVGYFATRLCGSQDLYGYAKTPLSSVNFITAHDGFTLRDLVSYNSKHNLANGEENRDGLNENESWNCGAEGETKDAAILALRARQMRNLFLTLMVSQGIPMMLMGDEYGHTKGGNNNTWCQDNPLNWFQWSQKAQDLTFFRFCKGLIHFRLREPLLRQTKFLDEGQIIWHGVEPNNPDWSIDSHFLAYTLHNEQGEADLYIAFNAGHEAVSVTLPLPEENLLWCGIIDTSLAPPGDFTEVEEAQAISQEQPYQMAPYSAILLKALPKD